MVLGKMPLLRERERLVSSREFILEHLSRVGEDYIAAMHRAYKQAVTDIELETGRTHRTKSGRILGRRYRRPTYHSFEMMVQRLAREGQVAFSGHEEESDDPRFRNSEMKPVRRYYQLVGAPPVLDGQVDGHRNGTGGQLPGTRPGTNGHRNGRPKRA